MPLPLKSLAYAGACRAGLLASARRAGEGRRGCLAARSSSQAFGDRAMPPKTAWWCSKCPGRPRTRRWCRLTVRVPPQVKQNLKSLTLFIDKNPDPKVATLNFGPAAGNGGERSFSTRVRIDNFSYVRAVLETEDGSAAHGEQIRRGGGRLRRHAGQGSRQRRPSISAR